MISIKRALISVSDKSGLDSFVKTLRSAGVEIISTGGTAKKIEELGIPVVRLAEFTGSEEMMDGRVKTLHPKIHAGLLAVRDNPQHLQEVKKHDIKFIDMAVVNLYPFEKIVSSPSTDKSSAIENIDIGGPSMLRSAAKNFESVVAVSDPAQYPQIISEFKKNNGRISKQLSAELAVQVFNRTSGYDKTICTYLKSKLAEDSTPPYPGRITLSLEKVRNLRYGENPHQKAALYRDLNDPRRNLLNAKQLHGKELSFNNINDCNAAMNILAEFSEPAAVVIKHTNPCGMAVSDNVTEAFKRAWAGDPLSAFGSVIGLNRKINAESAQAIMNAGFVEAIIANGFEPESIQIFKQKKNLRLLEVDLSPESGCFKEYKNVAGGMLVQDCDCRQISKQGLKSVTKNKPSSQAIESLLFAWKICKHVKSNAIVLARDKQIVGIGAGQMSRVDSVIIACRKAEDRTQGAVLASDAFFPHPDAIEQADKAGITSIIQPGGSVRDNDIIDSCNQHGISMCFTGIRHFKH